jgi:hypothetical protein
VSPNGNPTRFPTVFPDVHMGRIKQEFPIWIHVREVKTVSTNVEHKTTEQLTNKMHGQYTFLFAHINIGMYTILY